MIKEVKITLTDEEIAYLIQEELADIIQLRLDRALINDLKRSQEVNNIDDKGTAGKYAGERRHSPRPERHYNRRNKRADL